MITSNLTPKLFLSFLLILFFQNTDAQQAILSSGGTTNANNGSMSYSIGQATYHSHTSDDGSISQGVQQVYQIEVVNGLENNEINLNVAAYPNPTSNYLTLQVDKFKKGTFLTFQLYNVEGKLLLNKNITQNTTLVEMAEMTNSTYYLKITGKQGIIKTFKINKN